MLLLLRGLGPVWCRASLSCATATITVCNRASLSSDASDKLYELRQYKIKPDRYADFLKLVREKYAEVMMPHGKMVGYWAGNVGGLNEVQHLWEYDDYAHRDVVTKSKIEDKRTFEEYLSSALPMVISHEHTVMRAFPWYTPRLEPKKWGVYELVTMTVKPGMVSQLEQQLLQGLPARLAEDYPPPLAFWYSEFGNTNLVVHLWPHESLDKRDEHRRRLFESNEEWRETWHNTMKFLDKVDVKGLTPLPFSPLQ